MNREKILHVVDQIEEIAKCRVMGHDVRVTCPLAEWRHHKRTDNKPAMYIKIDDTDESVVHCFSCEYVGTLHDMVNELNVLREDAAYAALEEEVFALEVIDFGKKIASAGEKPRKKMSRADKEDALEARSEDELTPYRHPVPPYATERGILPETALAWELGDDRGRGRLTFPVRRAKDKALVGLSGRSYRNQEPKYYSGYFDWPKSKYLYGEHMVLPGAKRVLVVEGQIDVVTCWQRGEFTVGIMGRSVSPVQMRKIEYLELPVYMCPDGDGAGVAWANVAGDDLRDRGVKVRDVRIPWGSDPKDVPRDEFARLLDTAPMRI